MNSQKFTFEFALDASTVASTAQKLQQEYNKALANIKVPIGGDLGKATAQAKQAQDTITRYAQVGAGQRETIAEREARLKVSAAQTSTNAAIEDEKKITAAAQSESAKRTKVQQNEKKQGGPRELIPGYEAVQGVLSYTIAGFAIGTLVQKGAELLVNLDQQATAYQRIQVAAVNLAGSQDRLNTLMAAYDEATGGIVDKEAQMRDVTKLLSIGYADTTQELTRFTTAVRGVSIATGQTQENVSSQLSMAIANQSIQRLDNIGLSADEVKKKIDALKAANKGMTDAQAYQEAILTTADDKFGNLVKSSAAAATGIEKLTRAWADMNSEMAERDKPWIDMIAGGIANAIDPDVKTMQERIQHERTANATQPSWLAAATFQDVPRQAKELDFLANAYANITKAQAAGLPVDKAYIDEINALSNSVLSGKVVNDERERQEKDLQNEYGNSTVAAMTLTQYIEEQNRATAAAAQARRDDAAATEEWADKQAKAGGELANLIPLLYQAGMGMKELQDQIARNAGVGAAAYGVSGAINSAAANLVPLVGPDEALKQGQQMQALLTQMEGTYLMQHPEDNNDPTKMAVLRKQWEMEVVDPLANQVSDHNKAIQEGESAAKRAASEAEASAKKTAQELQDAAKKMADDFESSLHTVEGLFKPSEVTELDTKLAAAGLYQPKADEFLRQLRDEVQSGQDKYQGVDIKDFAKFVNVPAATDPKLIMALVDKAAQDLSLYSNQEVLKYINPDAVQQGLLQNRRSQLGSANLSNYAGMNPAIVQAAGYSGVFPGRFGGPVSLGGGSAMGADGQPLTPQDYAMVAQDASQPIQDSLIAAVSTMGGTVGQQLATSVFKAFSDQAKSLPWMTELTSAITDQVERDVLSGLNGSMGGNLADTEQIGVEH